MRDKRAIKLGTALGFAVAGMVSLLAQVNRGGHPAIEAVTNFFAGLPMLLLAPGNFPDGLLALFFFGYWIVLGGSLGWLVTRRDRRWIVAVLFIGGSLMVAHRIAQVHLQHDVEMILKWG